MNVETKSAALSVKIPPGAQPEAELVPPITPVSRSLPRLGFLGVGWIGRHRLESVARSGVGEIAAVADLSPELVSASCSLAPNARRLENLDELVEQELDGIVIATPSALHAEQAIAALTRGKAVFCQKPLARSARETREVINAARRFDLLLGVDFSYRHVTAIRRIHELCRSGELGEIYAVELVFHNAYGPDKPWFYDREQSGGGCAMDLGIHLADLALWNLNYPPVRAVNARMYSHGRPLRSSHAVVEDYAVGRLECETGASVQLSCSWKLPVGCDAVISGAFYGTKGGAAFRNRDGSFYDFLAERFEGTTRRILADEREDWSGRAILDWANRLGDGARYDPQNEEIAVVAEVLDRIYESGQINSARGLTGRISP